MPDITMCRDNLCPRRCTCYRYRVIPNDRWQSFFASRMSKDGKGCKHYAGVELDDYDNLVDCDECDKDALKYWNALTRRNSQCVEA